MKRASAPSHAELASFPASLVRPEDVPAEVDRLDSLMLETAQALLEGNWRGAARSAYTAAWVYHRLPEAEQRAYAESPWHDDTGPLPIDDEWSSSAFVAWLIWRIGLTATPRARRSPPVQETRNLCTSVESEQKGLGL